jgi:ATP-dependent DNA ligase
MIIARSMEARSAPDLPRGDGWWFEPKWDGFRCLAFKDGAQVRLQARSGKSLNRYFPEMVTRIAGIEAEQFVADGELLVATDSGFSFEALQMRLHPAQSRIQRLSQQSPSTFMVFDMLVGGDGVDLRASPLTQRHSALVVFTVLFGDQHLRLSDGTADRVKAQAWLDGGGFEGVVAKRLDGPYAEGERAMVKVKRLRTVDCVAGGFRYSRDGAQIASLLLGLYNRDGRLDHVGFTSGLAAVDRGALTQQVMALRDGPGFTGKAPGGPSRWSDERSSEWEPLRPDLVVEVSFDHVSGGRFRHGARLLRLRPDKAAAQCTMEQLFL